MKAGVHRFFGALIITSFGVGVWGLFNGAGYYTLRDATYMAVATVGWCRTL